MLDYLANHCLNHALGCLRGHDLGEGETRPGEQVAPFRRSAFAPARKHESGARLDARQAPGQQVERRYNFQDHSLGSADNALQLLCTDQLSGRSKPFCWIGARH
jgi:hypothetical protein